jgi:hypothetical protein
VGASASHNPMGLRGILSKNAIIKKFGEENKTYYKMFQSNAALYHMHPN